MTRRLAILVAIHLAGACIALGQVQTFRNDYAGFVNAAGNITTIDFETLPDGTPSDHHTGTPITSAFNYDLQGAHFSAQGVDPIIAGNTVSGFDLWAYSGATGPHTWITADLINPARAVGIFFPGGTRLCAFNSVGGQIACATYQSSGDSFFLGIVSEIPIVRITQDRGTSSERMGSFLFSPVPEPGTGALFGLGAAFMLRRARRTVRWARFVNT